MQRRATQGKTPASRLKTLYLHLHNEHGPAAADAFLLSTRLDRDFLSDETRLVPIELWHSALGAFASRWGRESLPTMARAAVHPDNLGVWTHVLRGARLRMIQSDSLPTRVGSLIVAPTASLPSPNCPRLLSPQQ